MSSPKMFEVMSAVYRLPNFLLVPIRKYIKKAEFLKVLMKENKANFGPLLETSKERRKRVKSSNNKEKDENSPEITKIENVSNENELSWVMKSTRMKNLRILKINKKVKSLDSQDKEAIDERGKEETIGLKEIIPSTEKIFLKKEDTSVDRDNNRLFGTINEKINLEPLVNDSLYVPIWGSSEEDEDNWEGSEILSLKPKEKSEFYFPGVTRILNETMSEKTKKILEKWKMNMIKELGEEGFEKYCNKLLEDSKIMHLLVEKTLRKEELPDIPVDLKPCFSSMKLILKDLTDVRMLESHVVHPTLGYRGFVDCVAKYRGDLCIIDWKKSEKFKSLSTTYDSPLQLSAYIGALNADPNYPFQVKSGILAIAYTRGQLPSVFQFTETRLEFYWREWLKRLEQYKTARKCI